ncbi:MAG: bifunctional (p)ppGpp synthetase/guanosine-3',5'-bis(diphosphate) 3'-pyrophosphohydrolase [Pseudomonadota bacterium]|nr:bifunctional (p)ppGpp synthetase/guanosine-3',5'-bis(diphosphate) 3'-pyrophosphohydrolase [Pseudomonadota bacterium]
MAEGKVIRQYELVDRVKSYDNSAKEDALNRAYVFSMMAHGTQKRESGDPYFSHPLEVAGILTELKLDSDTIITGLLHDTVEDTVATIDEIQKQFGDSVAHLVDGVTKLSKFELQSANKRQVENFRKLLMATSRDIRVLLVKLADRLHNMRTLGFITDSNKRARIAQETMEIYAPLAERIGMQGIKNELEDLAFIELYPDARNTIVKRLEFLRAESLETEVIYEISNELNKKLKNTGLSVEVSGREKKPYSIWLKMQRQNVEFAQLSDIMAFRVVVKDLSDCYQALGIIHGNYSCVPGRFKDYISTPKRNGYKSIHTVIIGPQKRRIELQIRTKEMHEVAELGVAAHWQFKQDGAASDNEIYEYRWVRELLDILEHANDPDEFLEHTKLDLFQEQVFCFTPKGELIALPRGSTPVDFAYEVHSEVGDACVGAKINGRLVQLHTKLLNGDQIEIITSKPGIPSPDWEKFVVTAKARSRIRRFIRTKERTEYQQLGKAMIEKAFSKFGYQFSEQTLKIIIKSLNIESLTELYIAVGRGIYTANSIVESALDNEDEEKIDKLTRRDGVSGASNDANDLVDSIPIRGLIPGVAVHYSNCCHPLPGDRIVGIQTRGKGVSVHTIDCESLESFHDMPERWVDISWDLGASEDQIYTGRLSLVVANQRGGLASVATVVANGQGNITNLKITSRARELMEMLLDIEVHDSKHLNDIMASLRGVSVVSSVSRVIQ